MRLGVIRQRRGKFEIFRIDLLTGNVLKPQAGSESQP